MRLVLTAAAALFCASLAYGHGCDADEHAASAAPLALSVNSIDGKSVRLDELYAGKVVLVVNTASRCGLTPQYAELEQLYRDHKEDGLVVLAFPCNQFGGQEPGTAAQIKQFCTDRFEVSFPLFDKVEVNGPNATELFKRLKQAKPGDVRWNFTKFLIGRDGQVIERFEPRVRPSSDALRGAVAKALEVGQAG